MANETATCQCGAKLWKSDLTGFWWHSDIADPKLIASQPHEPKPA